MLQKISAGLATAMYIWSPIVYIGMELGFVFLATMDRCVSSLRLILILALTTFVIIHNNFSPILEVIFLYGRQVAESNYCHSFISNYVYTSTAILHALYIFLTICQVISLIIIAIELNTVEERNVVNPAPPMSTETTSTTESFFTSSSIEWDLLKISPNPICVPELGSCVVNVRNTDEADWVVMRVVMMTVGAYHVQPSKLFIPPRMSVSVDIRHQPEDPSERTTQQKILFEAYPIGLDPPRMELARYFVKPYPRPLSSWSGFMRPVYLEKN